MTQTLPIFLFCPFFCTILLCFLCHSRRSPAMSRPARQFLCIFPKLPSLFHVHSALKRHSRQLCRFAFSKNRPFGGQPRALKCSRSDRAVPLRGCTLRHEGCCGSICAFSRMIFQNRPAIPTGLLFGSMRQAVCVNQNCKLFAKSVITCHVIVAQSLACTPDRVCRIRRKHTAASDAVRLCFFAHVQCSAALRFMGGGLRLWVRKKLHCHGHVFP